MRRRRTRQHEKGFLLAFRKAHTQEKKRLFRRLFSLTPPPVHRQQEMKMNGGAPRRDKSFPSLFPLLSFFQSGCISLSLPLLAAYDDVTRLLSTCHLRAELSVTEHFLNSFFTSLFSPSPRVARVLASAGDARGADRRNVERMPGSSAGMFGFVISPLKSVITNGTTFFNFLFCLDSAG